MSPPTNEGNLVPNGALIFYSDNTNVPMECGAPCFAYDCYNRVPDSCCDGADQEWFTMEQWFSDMTCVVEPYGPYLINFAGGCSEEGEFFYGEQCGGSTFGPFTEFGFPPCDQPDETCSCNAYVKTSEAGCFTVGTPLGASQQFFLRVNDEVCTPAPGNYQYKDNLL